jgi:ribose 5-phosphate isomerase B
VAASDLFTVGLARAHNDANVLALGARIVGPAHAEAILDRFLESGFEGGRHAGRVAKLDRSGRAEES